MVDTPDHLGGHLNKTHIDGGALRYIIAKFNIERMVDIGCGTGGMVDLGRDLGLYTLGVDGDPNIIDISRNIMQHDFVDGDCQWEGLHFPVDKLKPIFDLAWSVEFLEHVKEEYQDNYMKIFEHSKYAMITHAFPEDTGGHHHVNLQLPEYWIDVFMKHGFRWREAETLSIKRASTMKKPFIKKSGLFFVNERFE